MSKNKTKKFAGDLKIGDKFKNPGTEEVLTVTSLKSCGENSPLLVIGTDLYGPGARMDKMTTIEIV